MYPSARRAVLYCRKKIRPESGSPYNALAMRYSCAGSRPHTMAIWCSRVVTASYGNKALMKYADLMSIVAM